MTVSRFKHVRVNNRAYTVSFNSATEVSVTTYTRLTEEGYRKSEPELLKINRIDYTVVGWLRDPAGSAPWRIADVHLRREPFSSQPPTASARSLVWADMREILANHVVNDFGRLNAGQQHKVEKDIERTQEEIDALQIRVDSMVKGLEHLRNRLVSP